MMKSTDLRSEESVFGTNGPQIEKSMCDLNSEFWLASDKGLSPHIDSFEHAAFIGSNPRTNTDLKIKNILLNSEANRTESIYVFDKAGIKSRNFAKLTTRVIESTRGLKSARAAFANDTLTFSISQAFVSDRGVTGKERKWSALLAYDLIEPLAQAEISDDATRDLYVATWMYALDVNGHIDETDDMKEIVLSKDFGINADDLEDLYLGYHTAELLKSVSLESDELSRTKTGPDSSKRLMPKFFALEMSKVFDRMITTVKQLPRYRQQLHALSAHSYQVLINEVETVPVEIVDDCLDMLENLTWVNYVLDAEKKNRPQLNLVVSTLELGIKRYADFLSNSDRIIDRSLAQLADMMQVDYTRDLATDAVEAVVMTTTRDRADGRDIFYKTDTLASFDKMYSLAGVGSQISDLLPATTEAFDDSMYTELMLDAIGQSEMNTGKVFNFTSTKKFDRDLFALALAVKRSRYISVERDASAEGIPSLVFECLPTEIISGTQTQKSLNDIYRTRDPLEVIALTGEQKSSGSFPGYSCQLQLSQDGRNLVKINDEEIIARLDDTVYTANINVMIEGEETTAKLETNPLQLLNLDNDYDAVYTTLSVTNRYSDILTVRKIVTTWMLLSLEELKDPEKKVITTHKVALAETCLMSMIELVVNNPVSVGAIRTLLRKMANEQGIFKNYRRFYQDEAKVLKVVLYISSVLLANLAGMQRNELNAIETMIDETDATSRALINRKVKDLLKL